MFVEGDDDQPEESRRENTLPAIRSMDSLSSAVSSTMVEEGKERLRRCRSLPKLALEMAKRQGLEMGPVEVACVDDSPVQLCAFKQMLRRGGFNRVVALTSAQKALELLEERKNKSLAFPTIMLMDANMPGIDGIAATRLIRSRYPWAPMPIIMITGDMSEQILYDSFDAGVNDFVPKPYTNMNLMCRLGAQLNLLSLWKKKIEATQHENLLKQMLPTSVISRLHEGQSLIFDELEEVSIIFSDIVGFTEVSASVRTEEVIKMLDELFATFDTLTTLHRVYKVETIGEYRRRPRVAAPASPLIPSESACNLCAGDAYMIVAGHEEVSRKDHAVRAVKMASDMVKAVSTMTMPNGKPLNIRVGIHTGPAFAGVVGRKMPRYCLFGDTVNTASRMESNSYAQCVHLSDQTYKRYMDTVSQGEACETGSPSVMKFIDHGYRRIKGKGDMRTWLACTGEWESAVRLLQSTQLPSVSC